MAEIDEFDPAKKTRRPNRRPFSTITLQNGGTTNDSTWIWSGDTLMDLNRYEALKMTLRTLDGTEYLFVEAGGFSTRHKPGWKSKLYVLKRMKN